MRVKLTDISIQKLPHPAKGQAKYWDQVLPGFGVRVTQRTKSYFIVFGPKRLTKTLGRYPAMSLKQARAAALATKVTDTPQTRLESLYDARTAFLADCQSRLRQATVNQYTFYLQKTDQTTLSKINKQTLTDHTPHCIASWKAFFNWCIRQEIVTRNPFALHVVSYGSRTRVLTSDELKTLWAYDFPPYSDYIKLQILTGQRIGQWANYTIKNDTITFPSSTMKGKVEHTIPLTDTVATLLPVAPFNGWSKGKARLDRHVPLDAWTVHDLRRTFSTICASLDIPLHVTERILAHTTGQVSGVAATYNRYNYLKEMKIVLDTYDQHIQSIVT